jgi:hypothetical protein
MITLRRTINQAKEHAKLANKIYFILEPYVVDGQAIFAIICEDALEDGEKQDVVIVVYPDGNMSFVK